MGLDRWPGRGRGKGHVTRSGGLLGARSGQVVRGSLSSGGVEGKCENEPRATARRNTDGMAEKERGQSARWFQGVKDGANRMAQRGRTLAGR